MHGAHQHAILELGMAQVQGFEKIGIPGQPANGGEDSRQQRGKKKLSIGGHADTSWCVEDVGCEDGVW